MNRIAFLLGTLLTLSLSQTASAAVELYKQNFDAFTPCSTTCGAACVLGESWENDPADNVPNRDWATDFGGTPSSPTGPSDDRTGGGNYLYFESSSSCSGSDTANVTSPVIDLTSTVSPGVSFWYHMYGSSMGDLHVDILDENKNVLQLDVIPSITDNKDEWQNASFPIVAYIGQKIRVRFRGVSGSSYWSDMAIDDFEAFDLVPDVGITSLGGPKQQACGTSAANIVVNVSNFGAEAVDVPVEVTLSGAVNTVLNATLPGVLAFGETKKLELGPVDLLNGGTLSVSAKTVLMGDTDTANDTYEDDVQIKSAVIPVAPPAATVCPGSSAVFAATLEADASAVWFDANDGGNLIGLGSIFSTPETANTAIAMGPHSDGISPGGGTINKHTTSTMGATTALN